MLNWNTLFISGGFFLILGLVACQAIRTPTAILTPDIVLDGVGENVDTIAFWEGEHLDELLMFVTAKGNSQIEVWPFPFSEESEEKPIQHESFGDSFVNGVVVDQERDKLYVSVADSANKVVAFSLPALGFDRILLEAPLGGEPGIDLYQWPDGRSWVYTTADGLAIVYIQDANTGEIIQTFEIGREIETVLADEFHEVVYIPDENGRTGVYAYAPRMEPFERDGRSRFGYWLFQADAEGILIYACETEGQDNGQGFIVVSDQRHPTTDFEFFDRLLGSIWERSI